MDPNFTLFSNEYWTYFRNYVINIGYSQKNLSLFIYLFGLLLITFLSKRYQFAKTKPQDNKISEFPKVIIFVAIITLFSYPFLSHDFFNYLFDAKIFTFYGKNPYLFAPQAFLDDPWLRFMHWVHRTYPYGPAFLPISIIPVFLAKSKLFLSFIFYKIMQSGFYLLGAYSLYRLDKKQALIFALSPLVLIEGLINAHNDLIAVSIGLFAISIMLVHPSNFFKKFTPKLVVLFFLLLGGLIKYISIPSALLIAGGKKIRIISFVLTFSLVAYLCISQVTQPWYFLNLYIFLPFFPSFFEKIEIFFFGLLLSYVPYILHTGWGEAGSVQFKNQIIITGIIANICFLVWKKYKLRLPINGTI